MKDLFGKALLDYQTNNSPEPIITETNISEPDEMDVAYLFRAYDEMPKIEQKTLEMATGKILDVGCGAGSHSLYLQEKGYDVTSIDLSAHAIEACNLRGLKNATAANILDLDENQNKFDTLLLLMNGTGIFESIEKTPLYLKKLRSLLRPNGQILIDSSDIIYMYDEDDEALTSKKYYGELIFTISYKNEIEKPFPWMYLDFERLQILAKKSNFQCEKILDGTHYDYLARLF
jgi:2-polyprenyl-3-methyl-5-hydroxy-6-metoxy-1,4-benzoquinol methylase